MRITCVCNTQKAHSYSNATAMQATRHFAQMCHRHACTHENMCTHCAKLQSVHAEALEHSARAALFRNTNYYSLIHSFVSSLTRSVSAVLTGAGTLTRLESRNIEWHKPKSRMFSGHLFYWFLCILFDLIKLWTTLSVVWASSENALCLAWQNPKLDSFIQCTQIHIHQLHITTKECCAAPEISMLQRFPKISIVSFPCPHFFPILCVCLSFPPLLLAPFHFSIILLSLANILPTIMQCMHNDNRSRLSTPINWWTS